MNDKVDNLFGGSSVGQHRSYAKDKDTATTKSGTTNPNMNPSKREVSNAPKNDGGLSLKEI